MIEQPNHSPSCCGQTAKWVNPTLNLAYFYCTKCKREVEELGLTDLPMSSWAGVLHSDSVFSVASQSPQAQAPSGRKFKVGDTVSFDLFDSSQGHYKALAEVICYTHSGWYQVKTLRNKISYTLYETDLTLVP